MNTIRTLAAAALIAATTAGAAGAQSLAAQAWNKVVPSVSTGGEYALGGKVGAIAGGTFALWTFGRFLNGCSPFRC